MTTTIFPRCPHCRETMSPMDHGRCTHCGKLCGCSFAPESMSDYCDSHRPAPRREDAAGEDEETPIRRALVDLMRVHGVLTTPPEERRHAFEKVVELHIDALDESRAALSTAEREQGANALSADNLKWRSRIDALREFFRDSAYAAEQELQRRGAPSEDHFVRQQRSYLAWLDELRDIFFARVPSGGEEGRSDA